MDIFWRGDKGKAAVAVQADCAHSGKYSLLINILNVVLNPKQDIDDEESIEWCRWIMAGGLTPEEFSATVRRYDKAATCGLVWTANFVAYRCRTCGISPFMSLCAECFKHGNHEGHDFIMFRSETGGACDCGEINVVKESGCCSQHVPHSHDDSEHKMKGQTPHHSKNMHNDGTSHEQTAPPELLCVSNAMMPRLLLRLIQHMRQQGNSAEPQAGISFIKMLKCMTEMGAPMRQVITQALTNPQIYKSLTDPDQLEHDIESTISREYSELTKDMRGKYLNALKSVKATNPPKGYRNIISLPKKLEHKTFLEELVFWTVKLELPENLIGFLLSLRQDPAYKEAFTRAFVLHYGYMSQLLLKSSVPEVLCNRVVTVSVQIFSLQQLSIQMVETMQLLYVIILSLRDMIKHTLVPRELPVHEVHKKMFRKVVDCDHEIMKNNYYAPLKSDLNEVLSHEAVALKFLRDDSLLKVWFEFLSMFQGMNINRHVKKGQEHVKFESDAFLAAITAELEISSTPMWSLLSHAKDATTADMSKRLLQQCWEQLKTWILSVKYDKNEVSFHLPLHRYFSMFIQYGVLRQGLSLTELLPPGQDLKLAIRHLIRVQVAFYQIISGLWVRNGEEIVHQASHYIGSLCCNSMADSDIFLLQVCGSNIPQNEFFMNIIDSFNLKNCLRFENNTSNTESNDIDLTSDEEILMLEQFLLFLATLTTVRTNLGMSEEDILTLEMATLLCKDDRTHSQLMELMPERCVSGVRLKNFETVLAQVADYRDPKYEAGGSMTQRMYVPKPFVWETLYDPIYVLLRANHRPDYQTSRDRFNEFIRRSKKWTETKGMWPPFQIPKQSTAPFPDPRNILKSRVFHGTIFVILYKAVYHAQYMENVIALAIYLLELAVSICETFDTVQVESIDSNVATSFSGTGYADLYTGDSLVNNLTYTICRREVHNTEAGHVSVQGDSIISLLLKLHSQFSGTPNSFTPYWDSPEALKIIADAKSGVNNGLTIELQNLEHVFSYSQLYNILHLEEHRIGDGQFFVGKLLDKISKNDLCRLNILKMKQQLWPESQLSTERLGVAQEELEREEKRRKVKERKLQIIADFAKKRQQFIDISIKDEESNGNTDIEMSISPSNTPGVVVQIDCAICLQSSSNSSENPIGLVTFLHSSTVLEHRRNYAENSSVVTNTVRNINEQRWSEYNKTFDHASTLMSVPGGCAGGVYVQTCGHILHMNCLNAYLNSLNKTTRNKRDKDFVNGMEYSCPMCRQMGNSFLPLIPDINANTTTETFSIEFNDSVPPEIPNLLRKRFSNTLGSKVKDGINKFLQELKDLYVAVSRDGIEPSSSATAQAYVIASILRNNVEMDLSLRAYDLKKDDQAACTLISSSKLLKTTAVPSLMSVLKFGYKSLSVGHGRRLVQMWEMISGNRVLSNKEVPILFRDTCSSLIHFILQLPVGFDVKVFTDVVQVLYNVTLAQICCSVSFHINGAERENLKLKEGKNTNTYFNFFMGEIISQLDKTSFYRTVNKRKKVLQLSVANIEPHIQTLMLPYLRMAAVLRHHIYQHNLPSNMSLESEFVNLVQFLNLGKKPNDMSSSHAKEFLVSSYSPAAVKAEDFLSWISSDPLQMISSWCQSLAEFIEKAEAPEFFITTANMPYESPALFKLPKNYDETFTFYYNKVCAICNTVPVKPNVCLICGTLVCLQGLCCKNGNSGLYEAIQHSTDCGGGTGIFLSVLTSNVIVVLGRRACSWGSVYLDAYGEEDLELKRGKPLFLSKERYALLQQLWLTHNFENGAGKWFWHGGKL